MKPTSLHILLAAALCGAVTAQAAEPDRWYISADAGRSDFRLQESDLGALIPNQPGTFTISGQDKHDSTYGLHAGYRLNANFALEGGYSDLGTASFNGGRSFVCPVGLICTAQAFSVVDFHMKATAWDLALAGSYDLGSNWSVYGKAGASAVRIKTSRALQLSGAPSTISSRNSTVATLGAGVAYRISPELSMQVGWNRHFAGSADANNGKADIDAYTLGLTYHF